MSMLQHKAEENSGEGRGVCGLLRSARGIVAGGHAAPAEK